MVTGYNLHLDKDITKFQDYVQIGETHLSGQKAKVSENLKKYVIDGIVDGTQIEKDWFPQMEADVFMSAATEQMNSLVKEKYISKRDVVELLENKVVLIAPKKGDAKVSSFKDITKADTIALGDPKSVPAGQYAQEIFTNLKNWNDVKKKASFGTNVTEVLNWVAKGSASCGVVYATDAASNKDVKVLAEAPADALKTPVIYPVAALKKSKNKDAADKFVKFLQSEKVLKVFRSYGFTINK